MEWTIYDELKQAIDLAGRMVNLVNDGKSSRVVAVDMLSTLLTISPKNASKLYKIATLLMEEKGVL